MLLLKKTWAQFPALMWQFTAIYNSSSGGDCPLLTSTGTGMHAVHLHPGIYSDFFFYLNFLAGDGSAVKESCSAEEWSSVLSTYIEWLTTASSGLHGHLDGCMCEFLHANKQNYIIYLCVGGGGSACMSGTCGMQKTNWFFPSTT